ncbi:subtilisin-like protein [Colletotrichum zoysiae]|uniref:Subtilisin-like protein n=1 Tax=Colletotrichum zoysiae TaxID=1216348 RepID=A0AAD9H6I2_9PEZI|nr:subtilisin-like protein [Colletotrichum zoysiae]
MHEQAEIFIAKVFQRDDADEEREPILMAEAIRWAISQGVDIISISAGFATCPEPLRSAVHEAHAAHILIFAAASNWGNTDLVAFPARIKDHVYCIFATTGALKSARDINPEPRRNADNFAMLGQDISLEGHSNPVSGTSAATALAAGMAARVLDFVWNDEHQDDIQWVSLLQPKPSREGMTAVFRALVRSSEMYDCIQPRRMLPPPTEDNLGDLKASRAHVRRFLSQALKDAE